MGGGIYNSTSSVLAVNNCTISGNSAHIGLGGGVDNYGTLTVSDSTITGNSAENGAGIYNVSSGTATINNSATSLKMTPAAAGGGVWNNQGTLTITNSTISGNTAAEGMGGGVYSWATTSGELSITDSTISGNQAGITGGGINNSGFAAVLNGTIVAGNTYGDVSGNVSGTYNLIGDGTGMTGISDGSDGNQVGTSGSPIDPTPGTLGQLRRTNGIMALLPGSPAIDAGADFNDSDDNPIIVDQRGISRPQLGVSDIGAYESQGFSLTATGGTGTQITVVSTAFAALAIHVTAMDAGLTDLTGGVVTFTAPSSGASASLSSTITLDSSGSGSDPATANSTTGSYTITAS